MRALLLLFLLVLSCWSPPDPASWENAARSMLGTVEVRAQFDPDPPIAGANTVWLQAPVGTPPSVEAVMPAMGTMPEMRVPAEVTRKGEGLWRAAFELPMGGGWTLVVRSGESEARFAFTVGAQGLVGEAGQGAGEISHYTCSMHPEVQSETPGRCPICGMDLVPVTREEAESGAVRIDATRRQQFNVRTAPVVRGPLVSEVRGAGSIVPVEGRVASVALRVGGYARNVAVETGQVVRKGEVLFSRFAPELLVAQEELQIAHAAGNTALVEAARERLRRMDVAEREIAGIEAGQTLEAVPFRSPVSGHVLEKRVVEGDRLEAGVPVLTVAALDRVWVEAELFEPDASRVSPGATVHVSFPEAGAAEREGKVELLQPRVAPDARTRTIRIGLDNDDGALVPGMWVNVRIPIDLGQALLIPESAVLYTGPRRLVFVDRGGGLLSPREVQVGARTDGQVAVLEGLQEGEQVVASGTFLVAAESRVRSAVDLWSDDAER